MNRANHNELLIKLYEDLNWPKLKKTFNLPMAPGKDSNNIFNDWFDINCTHSEEEDVLYKTS